MHSVTSVQISDATVSISLHVNPLEIFCNFSFSLRHFVFFIVSFFSIFFLFIFSSSFLLFFLSFFFNLTFLLNYSSPVSKSSVTSVMNMTSNYLIMVRLQPRSFGEYGVPLYCHCS